jgi:DNA-directed RNA polymerase subunit beta'
MRRERPFAEGRVAVSDALKGSTSLASMRGLRISLASPDLIRSRSSGEVLNADTLDVRTLKPKPGGLFCERIFGPVEDFTCRCGKYDRRRAGAVCDKCGVEFTRKAVRGQRFGHIELAAPVAHAWFSRGIPCVLALLLDVSPGDLAKVLASSDHFIVTPVDESARTELVGLLEGTIAEAKATKTHQNGVFTTSELKTLVDHLTHERPIVLSDDQRRAFCERHGALVDVGIGAEGVLHLLKRIDLDALSDRLRAEMRSGLELMQTSGAKRLKVVESLRRHSLGRARDPSWMMLTVLPVLPPDLRPMRQYQPKHSAKKRFTTNDLTDLYRRVISRNNRLKRHLANGAPEIVLRNEKRMLQRDVDALVRSGIAEDDSSNKRARFGHRNLHGLSVSLTGKEGRFRKNLLGKRVDYSGRSVIRVGPELELHQCGLPRRMALDLFKPFVIHALVSRGLAPDIKSADRMIERGLADVWDVLGDVIRTRPVLLNRAPTLHRLGIQAFEPVLIEGDAIQIHPLICAAFNADFDGDQMAVHVPLSREAVAEARRVMLSTHNLLSPGSGEPIIAPTRDIVLGCYYLTDDIALGKGEKIKHVFANAQEARYAYDLGIIKLQQHIKVRVPYAKPRPTPFPPAACMSGSGNPDGGPAPVLMEGTAEHADEMPVSTTAMEIVARFDVGNSVAGRGRTEVIETTVGRTIFDEILPAGVAAVVTGEIDFINKKVDRVMLKTVVARTCEVLGNEATAHVVDNIKQIGFEYATQSGISFSVNDLRVPAEKAGLIKRAEEDIRAIDGEYDTGLITEQERYDATVEVWSRTTEDVKKTIQDQLSAYGSVYTMAVSGAKGNISQITQMAGMRGLMTDPSGRIIDLPIRSSFREGLTVLEYFISTHGARKGLADTALRTADSGYLTRRLVAAAHDAIILEEDCGTRMGVWLDQPETGVREAFRAGVIGRYSAMDLEDPETGEMLVAFNAEIDDARAVRIEALGLDRVYVRSPLTCHARRGLCRYCYGRDPATGALAAVGQAVGIVAAQAIGEPGTQLTMRTFHTGGVANGSDITSGLPRVAELFEARPPKRQVVSHIDGQAEILSNGDSRRIRIKNAELYPDAFKDDKIEREAILVAPRQLDAPKEDVEEAKRKEAAIRSKKERKKRKALREYAVPAGSRLLIKTGDAVRAGQELTEGPPNPQDNFRSTGPEAVQRWLVEEVQKVYRAQGVTISDKHIEVVVRQMLRWVSVGEPGDTSLVPNDIVDRFDFMESNDRVLAQGGEPATAVHVLLGVTKAALSATGFLSAASFGHTTRVLTDAALAGRIDRLEGMKENVILGRLIPAA